MNKQADAPANPYSALLDITKQYFGPAANRFLDDQIRNHLAKSPQTLMVADLPLLTDWIKLSINLLSDDQEQIRSYLTQLTSLTENSTAVR